MIWTLIVGLALAAPPAGLAADLAAELPYARAQLEACAQTGCQRADGARAAWLVALATYLETGVADAELSATVRTLDPGLWAQLPEVLLAAAGEPSAWVHRVGGHVGEVAPEPAPLLGDAADRVTLIRENQEDSRPRFFVLSEPYVGRPYDDPRLTLELKRRSGEPAARFYPAGDLCQQGPPPSEPAAPADEAAPLGVVDFALHEAFDPRIFAEEYAVWVDGTETLILHFGGMHDLPVGAHRIWMVRSDGVGPVMDVEVTDSDKTRVRDLAHACIADALRDGSEALAPHFRRLSERLPLADLYLAESDGKVRNARLWRWDGESLEEIPAR